MSSFPQTKIYHGGGKPKTRFSSAGLGTDEKTKVTVNDTTPFFLDGKFIVQDDLLKTILNPGGNEQLQIKSNGRARCTVNDNNFNYLLQKIVAGANVTITLLNPSGSESLSIASSGGGEKPLYAMIHATAGALGTNTLIPAPDGVWAGNGHGYYTGRNLVLKEIWALVNRLTSFSTGTITVNIRYVPGDGSRTTMVTGPSGTSLNSVTVNCPNSGGGFRYYVGDSVTGLNNGVNADNMIFCRISGKTINTATGITVLTFWEAA